MHDVLRGVQGTESEKQKIEKLLQKADELGVVVTTENCGHLNDASNVIYIITLMNWCEFRKRFAQYLEKTIHNFDRYAFGKDFEVSNKELRCGHYSVSYKNQDFDIDKFVDRNFYSDKYRVADRTMAIQFGKLPKNPFNGRNMLVGDYARTIVSNYAKVPTSNILAVGDKYRHITEKESWLLMGFDESDFEKAQALYPQRYIGGKECMCGILYRQAGNSIVVPVLQAILKRTKTLFLVEVYYGI